MWSDLGKARSSISGRSRRGSPTPDSLLRCIPPLLETRSNFAAPQGRVGRRRWSLLERRRPLPSQRSAGRETRTWRDENTVAASLRYSRNQRKWGAEECPRQAGGIRDSATRRVCSEGTRGARSWRHRRGGVTDVARRRSFPFLCGDAATRNTSYLKKGRDLGNTVGSTKAKKVMSRAWCLPG